VILFVEPDEVKELRFGDTVFRYREAPGDRVLAEMRNPENHGDDGQADTARVARVLIAEHLVGWDGLLDASGAEVEFSPENVARILPLLRWNVLQSLDAAVTAGWVAGIDSGKG